MRRYLLNSLSRLTRSRTGFVVLFSSLFYSLLCGLLSCVLLSVLLSACSLEDLGLRQVTENRVDFSSKQDRGFPVSFQGINTGSGELASPWRLPELTSLPRAEKISSEVIGLFTPLRPGENDSSASGNRDTVLITTRSGHVLLYYLPSGDLRQVMKLSDNLSQVAFYRDAALLAVANQQVIDLYALANGEKVYSLSTLKTRMNSLAFHPHGQSLLIGASDGRVYRWKFADQTIMVDDEDHYKGLERYYGHSSVVSSVVAHPYGRIFFSGDWSGTLSAFLLFDKDLFQGQYDLDLFGGRYLSKSTPRANAPRPDVVSIVKIAMSSTGKELFVALQDGRVELWDVRGFEKRAEFQAHKGLIYDIALSANGDTIATSGRDGRVVQWSFVPNEDPKLAPNAVIEFEVKASLVNRLIFMEDGRLIAGSADGNVLEVKKPVENAT